MSKENNDWLLYGGLAIGVYFLWKHFNQAQQAANPVTTNLQSSVDPGNALTQLTTTVVKAINPPATYVPASGNPSVVTTQQQQAATNPVQKSVDNTVKPVPVATIVTPVVDDSKYLMFQHGDYPGANTVTGAREMNRAYAAAIGEL